MERPLFTLGHSTADREQLVALLHGAGIESVVDVRTAPGSRHNPDVARGEMSRWLPEHGIGYRWERRLGGWRRDPTDSPDTGLRNRSFAGYAAHMRTPDFLAAVDGLLDASARQRTAVLCSESVWWRCHRRLIADFVVLARDVPVCHVMPDGNITEHRATDTARRRDDGLLVYDGDQPILAV
ncbi:MAG: DUF488 family protein [Pseudonocardiaceae bacterium]|nr:DUF488 family protein [Pseudonocardiaceae bacterium]